MTRRITLAILFTVWAMLIVGGLAAYITTRAVLLRDMDQSLRAGLRRCRRRRIRYIVRTELGQTMATSTTAPATAQQAQIIRAAFTQLADGTRLRTVTLRVMNGAAAPVVVTYSAPTDQFDRLLNTLALALARAALWADFWRPPLHAAPLPLPCARCARRRR